MPGAIPCETCGKSFSNQPQLNTHRKLFHPTSSELDAVECKCHKCDHEFINSLELNLHLSKCLDSFQSFTCIFCQSNRWFSSIALKKHSAEEHQAFLYVCEACGESFKRPDRLAYHNKITHLPKVDEVCKLCHKIFATRTSLQKHMFGIHGDTTVSHYKCPHCEFRTVTNQGLKDHVNAEHTKETVYQCESCDFKTYRYKNLQSHITIVHKKSKPNKCDQCTAAFYYKRDLANHMARNHRM